MSRIAYKPGTMLYPVPVVLVTSKHGDRDNIITIAWAGTICSDPPMLSISVRPERFSYNLIKDSGSFAVNLPGEDLANAVDFCGVKSGADMDKFDVCGLTRTPASIIEAPLIAECALSMECKVTNMIELGTHHLFLAEIIAVSAQKSLVDKSGRLCLEKARLLCYNHGRYSIASKPFGKFGFSIERKGKKTKNKK
jgi:flavin reductase (DIM6/NTAB) family NADH-FMN oxidoreductase RutF